MHAATSTVASTNACVRTRSPVRPSRRAIVTGMVSAPLRDNIDAAPNSPNDTAATRPAAAMRAGRKRRRSISTKRRRGAAPSTAAASCKPGAMLRHAGTSTRTASGKPITECTTATNHHAPRQSYQPESNVTMRPSPSVTGDTTSGTIDTASSQRPREPNRTTVRERPAAKTRATMAANTAVRPDATSESMSADAEVAVGGADSGVANSALLSTRLRQPANDQASPTRSDDLARATRGAVTSVRVTTTITTPMLARIPATEESVSVVRRVVLAASRASARPSSTTMAMTTTCTTDKTTAPPISPIA